MSVTCHVSHFLREGPVFGTNNGDEIYRFRLLCSFIFVQNFVCVLACVLKIIVLCLARERERERGGGEVGNGGRDREEEREREM